MKPVKWGIISTANIGMEKPWEILHRDGVTPKEGNEHQSQIQIGKMTHAFAGDYEDTLYFVIE